MAELLLLEENLRFSTLMVDTLSTILLTSTELFDLRSVDGCVVEAYGSNREFISVFWIRIYWLRIRISIHCLRIRIRIYHFGLNTDPNPGFDDQKLKKFAAEKKLDIFLIKNCNLLILDPLPWLNPDPIRIRIQIRKTMVYLELE